MKKEKPGDLIISRETEFINNRFRIKCSVFQQGKGLSIMMVVDDVLEEKFKIQFFKTKEAAYGFIKLLQAYH